MDPDDVDSAGIQTHDRLTGTPRSPGGGGRNDGWACYLLRRGWDLTRKAAIAGAAATAAPVVVPPLIVLSAAGVALSVPFAAYLASLAVTNHVMGALLRCSAPQPYHHQEDDDDVEQEFLDASEEYGHDAPAFGHFDTAAEQGEEDESDTSLLLPRDHGVSEAPFAADAEEVGGEFSVQEYGGQESYTTNRGDETEEHTPVEGNDALPRGFGFGVPVSAQPLFADKDNQVQKDGEGEFSVLDSGQQPFQPKNWNEKGADVYSKNKEEDDKTVEEHKPTKEKVSQGFFFPESCVPVSGDDDNVVQEKGEGEISVQDSGQQSFETKDWNDKEEEDGKTRDENKSAKETLSQGFYFPEPRVPASVNKDDIVQEKGEGEFSTQNLDQYSFLSKTGDEKEQGMTVEESKSTEDIPLLDFVVSESSVLVLHAEDDVVQSQEGCEVAVLGVVEESNSSTDLVMGEVADVQVEVIAIAAPGSEVLPPSDHFARESLADLVTGEIVGVYTGIAATAEPESEVLHPTSESPADPVTGESVDVQLEIISIAAPESEVLPLPSNLVASESPADIVTGEVVDVCVSIAAAVEPESEVLHPSNLATSESPTGPVTEEIVDVQVDIVAAAAPGREVLPLSSLAASESQAVAETAQVGEVTGITVMGEVAEVQVGSIAIAAPETESEVLPPSNVVARELLSDFAAAASGSEVLHPSNLATSESPADPVTREIVAAQVDIVAAAAPGSEVLPLSSLTACESQAVAETAGVGEVTGITVTEDVVKDIGDASKEGASFVPVASAHDGEDVMSSGSTPYLSTVEEEMIDQPNQPTGKGYPVTNEAFGSRDVAGGEADYTEEQLREQLDTIRTITGYGALPSSTLEGELAGLYIFVGVEPAVGSVDISDRLMELNAKLRFLKSIIGVD